ncbi:MAG: GEVED domain-containing protein [Bacteroidia bacterium]
MKKIFNSKTIAILAFLLNANFSNSQCGTGYTLSSINWDLQYNNGAYTVGSTGSRFAIGINSLLITSSGTVTSSGSNATHTGNGGVSVSGSADPTSNYDANYTIGNGTITLTFYTEVQNVSFSLFDIDNLQTVNVTAANGSSTAQNVTLTALGSSTLTLSGNNTSSATATGASGGIGNSSNNAAVTVNVAGTVKTLTLTFTKSSGTDMIWLSDITACTNGTFSTNYHSAAAPESAQPEYFLVARSNSINIVNANTGVASLMCNDAALSSINSLAYDNANQIVYYTSEEYISTNKTIYKYDVKTGSKTTFISDVTASPYNMVLSNEGLGSGAATYYDGSLYIGFEADQENQTGGAYRIDLDANGNATIASRVFAKLGADATGQILGYGDFVINSSTLYLTDNASSNGLQLYNLNSMTLTNNYSAYKGQLSISSNGTPRFVDNTPSFGSYSGSGNWGTSTTITNSTGSVTNDASEVFKYPSDYGDAPSSYGTAYHVFAIPAVLHIKLGSTIDYELTTFNTTSSNGDDNDNNGAADDEDAISSLSNFNTSTSSYSATVSVFNTSGSAVSLYGWIDFNKNGIFDSGERAGSTGNVANNATSVTLNWTGITGVVAGQSYLRIRIGSVNGEVNTPSGKAVNGETEDYPLTIKISVGGTLYDDADGMTEITPLIDGTGIGLPSSTQLYVYLVSGSGLVVDKVTLPTSGVYSFSNVDPSTSYTVRISSSNISVGATAPLSAALPTDWVSTGENYGTNNSAGTGNETGSANSQITLTTGTSNITGLNFGIQKISSAYAKSYSGLLASSFNANSGNATFPKKIALNASSGTANTAVSSTSSTTLPGKLSGTDYEDGNYGGTSGSSGTRTVVFTVLPNYTNDVLVYNNGTTDILLVPSPSVSDASYTYWNSGASRYEIPSFNTNNLSMFFKANGHSSFSFTYAWKDAANMLGNAAEYYVSATSPLPMKLLYFGAELKNSQVTIKWMTTSEFNIENYEIQRSTDLKTWSKVNDNVPNNSYSNISTYYSYDVMGNTEVVYYRLKETDYDGLVFFSKEVAVSAKAVKINFNVYPNPAVNNEVINVVLENKNHQEVIIKLVDLNGKVLIENTVSPEGSHIPVSLTNIPAGIYFVSVSNTTLTKTMKVIVK